jgi:RNA polymerase sigma-70 factor (ECF subfamily)
MEVADSMEQARERRRTMSAMTLPGCSAWYEEEIAVNDMSLVHACKEGAFEAFEQLVMRYETKLFRIAHHITNCDQSALEAVQVAFLKAYGGLDSMDEKSEFCTWILQIAVQETLLALGRHQGPKRVRAETNVPELMTTHGFATDEWIADPKRLYGEAAWQNILREQLQRLQPHQRVAFVLHDIEGLSMEDTAQAQLVSVRVAKARLSRARAELRELLTKYCGRAPGL